MGRRGRARFWVGALVAAGLLAPAAVGHAEVPEVGGLTTAVPGIGGVVDDRADGAEVAGDVGPGAPDWPDGPPPGSAFEPELAGAGPVGDGASGGSPSVETAAIRNEVASGRVAGSTRYATAAAISRRAFPSGAGTVYLARADLLVDAQSAGALTDGPVLLVPSCDGVPTVVRTEIARVAPRRVVALGGEGSVCAETLAAAAAGRATDRVGGTDRYATAALIARRAFPVGATTVYLASGEGSWSPDAVAGGSLKDGPVLLTGRSSVPSATRQAVADLGPRTVVALGGEAAVSGPALATAAAGRATGRLAGPDRHATAVAIAERAFGGREATTYLARSDDPADAVAGGVLTDGPTLLVPPRCGVLKEVTWRHLGTSTPDRVLALGGQASVCDEQLRTGARLSSFTPAEAAGDTHLLDLITKRRAVSPLRHVPGDLVAFRGGQHQLRSEVAQQLDALFRAAASAGHTQLHVTSGFRSYETQQATYEYWVRLLGQEEADRVSARAGHSEHQLGQAADVAGRACSGRDCFGSTPEGRWVAANAHRWGFIIRYPQGGEPVTGYVWEPWHLRYVGPRAAWLMHVRDEVYWDHYRSRAVRDAGGF